MIKLGEELKEVKLFYNGEYCNGEYYFGADVDKVVKETLDEIKEEIEELDVFYDNDYFSSNREPMFKCSDILQIIDKYMAKSEDKE